MSSLFSKSAIRQAISSFEGLNIDKEIAIVSELYDDFRKGNMKDETRYEQNFNELFFHQLLGYDPKINLHPKASTPVGSKIADVGLGFFEDGLYRYEGVKVVVELKGCDNMLDKKQASYGGQSPVDQGFGYKTSFKDCPWLIVSNFASVRLYRDNKQDFEVWTIEELANPDNEYYHLKTLLGLLKRNHLISQDGSSFSEKLLSEVRINQEVITKRFYQDYKNLRLELINDIRHHNPEIHVETVVEKAQKIIDRIIFIHFCEDKGLLPEGKLKTNVIRAREADFSPWDVLKRYFKGVDSGSEKLEIPHGYNGGLFHEDPVLNNLEIGDAICHKFIDLGNYSFDDELSVNILGHIFEQSISDIEQLKGELIETGHPDMSLTNCHPELVSGSQGSGIQNAEDAEINSAGHKATSEGHKTKKKESKRKKDGIFYTPEYIVDYIVQNSLMVYLEEKENECLAKYKKENEAYQAYQHILQNIKVLDPACGSGAFLVKVFDYLYAENKRVGQIVKSLFDDDEIYKSILRHNIYGVDLNPESVEITKLSLWLKSAQKGKKLNNLDDNIKCGNSLIDDPAVAGDRAFDWQKEFSDIMGAGGFDVIVGNPPYVFLRNNNMKEEEKNYYKETYLLYQLKPRTDIYFFERSYKLLKTEGYIGFITPNNILTVNSLREFRKYTIENFIKINIINLRGKIFFDANVDTMIISMKKNKDIKDQITIFENNEVNFHELCKIDKKEILVGDIIINYEMFLNKDTLPLIKKIEKKSETIDSFCKISNGIVAYKKGNGDPSMNQEMIDQRIYHAKQKKDDSWLKYINGSDVKRYSLNRSGTYIKYGNNLGEPRTFELFKNDHLLVRVIPSKAPYCINCMLIDKEFINDQNYIVLFDFNQGLDYNYILSILNSTTISFWFVNKLGKMQRGLFPQLKAGELKKFPIPKISLSKQQPFIDKADLMLSLNKDLHDKTDSFLRYISSKFGLEKLSTKLQKFYEYDFATFLKELNPRSSAGQASKLSMTEEAELMEFFENKKKEIVSLKNRIDATDREIDEMVYTLYGLNEEEKQIVEGS